MRIYKDVTIAFVNNPGTSKAGKPYYSLKWGPQEDRHQCWAKKGELDGLSSGDIVTVETLPDSKGGENLVRVIGKKAGNGAPLKSYRQDERPDAVHSKQVFGYSLAIFGRGDYRVEGVDVVKELAMCRTAAAQALALSDVWDRRSPTTSGAGTMKTLAEAADEAIDDAIPY